MLVELNGFICQGNIGNKAKSIVDLNRAGFKVPTSVALDTSLYISATKNIKNKIDLLIDRLTFDNIEIISKQIKILFSNVTLPDDICLQIFDLLHPTDTYLLRCSIDGVDSNYSYAGLYPVKININKSNIIENILECYSSLYSYNSLYYMLKNNIDISSISVAVIIQKEIKTNIIGYITSMDPVNLNTSLMSINLFNEKYKENYSYDYMKESFIYEDDYKIVSNERIFEIIELVKDIQSTLGYPVDIELAITNSSIYILHTRPINNILYDNKDSIYRKKNMSPKLFMYSLVNDTYTNVINEYYEALKIKTQCNPVTLEFNTCYYNVKDISNIIDSIVDYDNEYFYNNLNMENPIIRKNTFLKKIRRRKNIKILYDKIDFYIEEFDEIKNIYNNKYTEYCSLMSKVNGKDIEKIWLKIVFEDYNNIYKLYTDLKILVLIQKNNLFKELEPYLEANEFNSIINIIEETSKYKINKIFNELVKKIKNDEDAYKYWFSSSTLKILKDYNDNMNSYYHDEFRSFIDNYGYLSYFKFDLSESFYVEDVEDVIRDIKKQLANFEVIQDNEIERLDVIKKLQNDMMDRIYERSMSKIQDLQQLIINLSELKDIISKFNFIVKRFSKTLAKLYINKKILENESDIWYISINDIYNYIDGEIDGDSLKEKMIKSKIYYKSFRNYQPIDNIGYIHEFIDNYDYKGRGLSTDIVKGRVRIIKSLKELETLTHEDILVTKTINTNLLFQLPTIRGIIISDRYISNSTKNILRELKIPCIILDNCSKKLSDKSYIAMDGALGVIKKIRK